MFNSPQFFLNNSILAVAISFLISFLLSLSFTSMGFAQDSIVLRDLTLIEDISVNELNIDGIVLEGGLRYSWADILQGQVGEWQNEFEVALRTIGLPLFRIRSRLSNGDFGDLQPMTDQLLASPILADSKSIVAESKGRTAYIAWSAAMHDQLAKGKRVAAAAPLIKLLQIRNEAGDLADLDVHLGLRFTDDGICMNLLPIWFDESGAKEVLSQIGQIDFGQSKLGDNRTDPIQVYLHSLNASIAIEPNTANQSHFVDERSPWHPVLSAQSLLLAGKHGEVVTLLNQLTRKLNAPQRAIALYYLGISERALQSEITEDSNETDTKTDALTDKWKLTLLQIPAEFQDEFPDLSAAALFQTVEETEEASPQFASLRRELLGRFANTFHGRRYRIRNSDQ